MRQEKPHCFGLSCSLLVLLTCVFLRHAPPCKAQLSARNSCFTAAQGRPSYFFSSDIDRDISDLSDKRHERSTSIVDLPSLCCISIAKQRRTTKLRTAECRLQNDASHWYFGTLVERCKRSKGRGIHSNTWYDLYVSISLDYHQTAITFAVKLVVHAGNALVLSRLRPFQFLLWLLWAMPVTTARSVKHAVSPRFFCHACMSYDTHSNQLRKPAVRLCS